MFRKIQYDRYLFKKKRIRMTYDGDPRYTYRVGLDSFAHDGKKINWRKVRNAGFDFIIFRIGWRGYQSGNLHVDEHFHENMKGAIKEGFEIGVYVFSQAINEEEALEEAQLVIEELHGYPIRLPVVFDPKKSRLVRRPVCARFLAMSLACTHNGFCFKPQIGFCLSVYSLDQAL